jgi:polar amino acid transport system substrate-binding protein
MAQASLRSLSMITRRQALAVPPFLALSAARAQDTVAIGRAIAPTGKIRSVINVGHPMIASRLPGQAAPFGLGVDLARELARRLALEVELIVVPSAWRALEVLRAEDGDVGFFPVDSTRGQDIDFTAPYLEVEGTYVVRRDSPLTAIDDLDRRGTRIAVGLNSPHDLFLRRHLRAATMVRVANQAQVVDEFLRQGLDAAAGNRAELLAASERLEALRVLPGRFMFIEFALGIAAGRPPAALAYLSSFIDELKGNGFIAAALERHNIRAATVPRPSG